MLKYIISYCILFCSLLTVAQNKQLDSIVETKADSVNVFYNPKTYGLRIGIDLVKPVLSFIQNENESYAGAEIVADWRINTRLFAAGELGYTKRTVEEDYFTYTANGTYIKVGANYNLYTNWLDMDNETYIGARYGTSVYNNNLDSYTIAQYGTYFDPKTTSGQKYNNLNTHWVEFVAGLKVEVFKNVFLGFMISVSKMIFTNDPDNFENIYSPGMGKISKTGAAANFNYSISYRIPLYKK